jgi:hypothetical protein
LVPVVVLLLAVLTLGACGGWAWVYQRRFSRLLHRASPARPAGREPTPAPIGTPLPASAGTTESAARNGVLATEQLDRRSRSVLGWGRLGVVSVLAMDGTAIVACRSLDADTAGRERPCPRPRLWFRPRFRSKSRWPHLLDSDRTMVLLIGEGAKAEQACSLLERWERSGTVLSLLPTAVPGAVRVSDGRRSILWTGLMAD